MKQDGTARRGGLPRRRPLRRADSRDRRPPRGGDPVRHPSRWPRRCGRWSSSTGPARRRTARRTTSPGCSDKDSPVDTINGFIEVYMDARGVKGSWEALVFYVNQREDRGHPEAGRRRAVVRGPHAVGPEVPQAGRAGHHRQRHRRRRRDRRLRARSRRSASTCPTTRTIREQHGSKSVSLSNVNEAYDKSTLPAFRSEFAWTPEEAARADEVERVRRRADDQHARGDRPRLGQGVRDGCRAARRRRSRNSTRRSRRRAPIWSALYFLPDPKLVELGLVDGGGPGRDRPRRVRGLHAQRAGAAAARPRGHADRRRPHAQPPDDRPLADGQHQGDRGAAARRQDLST